MYVKKLLAATLAGAVLAGMFSGCNRKIVEHEFHVDTEYVKDYIEEEATLTFEDFEDMAGSINEDFNLAFKPDVVFVPEDSSLFTTIGKETIGEFEVLGIPFHKETTPKVAAELFVKTADMGIEDLVGSSLVFVKQTGDGVNGYISACLKGTKILCEALEICINGDKLEIPSGYSLVCGYGPCKFEDDDNLYVQIKAVIIKI
ncbi:MAG TPA: hypothetical protein H9771_05625 [Candidatus Faecalibacterium faecipullorum]|uniref:Lipoprotein n=1 Tax=Candidatus Faecalibacterium faecipullorum TaxID=2838578 RepID=A0A9D2MFB7_9FIRM|nr:hypothetical protein [Candidatus Faecalibacterium faecipullorum]